MRPKRLITSGLAVVSLVFTSLTLAVPANASSPMTLRFDPSLSGGSVAISVFDSGGDAADFSINWGDGTIDNNLDQGLHEHTYTDSQIRTVTLTGRVPGFGFEVGNDLRMGRYSLIEVVSFGDVGLKSLQQAFANAENLTSVPATLPTTVTDLSFAFELAVRFNHDIGTWNVSNVTTMENMFEKATVFNQNIGNWNVSNVTNMDDMFEDAVAFNQNIGNWNVRNVTTMDNMFEGATSFNQDISGWNTGSVIEMADMFKDADSFNQDISSWNVSNVLDMNDMFQNASVFDQNLGSWDIRKTGNMFRMFRGSALSRSNYDLTLIGWSNLAWDNQSASRSLDSDSMYCAASARQILLNNGFTEISDLGLEPYCPLVTASTISNGASNPSLTITGSSFKPGVQASDFVIDFGATGLRLGSVEFIDETEVRLVFSGTARPGTLSIRAGTSAYDPPSSSASDPLSLVIPGLPVPGAPANPSAVSGDGSATVSWSAPTTGGAPVTYTATSNPGGLTCTATAPSTSCVVSGLTNGISYTFSVTATNAGGTSSGSAASASVTPKASSPGGVSSPAGGLVLGDQVPASPGTASQSPSYRLANTGSTDSTGLAVLALTLLGLGALLFKVASRRTAENNEDNG